MTWLLVFTVLFSIFWLVFASRQNPQLWPVAVAAGTAGLFTVLAWIALFFVRIGIALSAGYLAGWFAHKYIDAVCRFPGNANLYHWFSMNGAFPTAVGVLAGLIVAGAAYSALTRRQ